MRQEKSWAWKSQDHAGFKKMSSDEDSGDNYLQYED